MKRSSKLKSAHPSKVAFLWDEAFLWALMSYKALQASGLPFDLIGSEDIRQGTLKDYSMLFVPGGWASNKLKALGSDGVSEIRRFVQAGGNYLGFCGGAGLATIDGMGLLNVKRKPTRERVPSFSGRIRLNLKGHPMWDGLREIEGSVPGGVSSNIFQAWWPSQLLIEHSDIEVLATYGQALQDAFSADLNVGDIASNGSWAELEKVYVINLDPARLRDEPAVLEGRLGKGKVILSLIHFDTPDDHNGSVVLKNLWQYLAGEKAKRGRHGNHRERAPADSGSSRDATVDKVYELEAMVQDLISFGMRNFLWFWRNRILLQWRRGVRGLEYCTLYAMVKEIAEIIRLRPSAVLNDNAAALELGESIDTIGRQLGPFVNDAKRLLFLERLSMQSGYITYEKCNDRAVESIRTELFSNSKSHGGLFKNLIDEIDRVLFGLIRRAEKTARVQ
jgi:Biotin-protein ligase, N terminal